MSKHSTARRMVLGFIGLVVSFAVGCQKVAEAPPPPPPPTVTVAKPILYSVQSYHEYNGYLEAFEVVEIRARVKGILADIHFNEGDEVQAGKLLYTIDPREYQAAVRRAEADIEKAEAEIASAEAQLKSADAELVRLKRAGASISGNELDKAIAAAAVSAAQIKISQANKQSGLAAKQTALLQEEFTQIKAPITGQISRTIVTKGNLVGQNETTLLTTIVRMDKLFVYFDAPERDLVEQLRTTPTEAGAAVLPVEVAVANEYGFPHSGGIDFRENRVDPGTGTIRVRGRLENPLGEDGQQRALYPGLFARVRVPAGPERKLYVVPEDAILTGQEGTYLYVVREGNIVKKQKVKLVEGPPVWRKPENASADNPVWTLTNPKAAAGSSDSTLRSVVAIETGLEESDVVIVAGLQRARPDAPVTPENWTFRAPAPTR